MEDTNIANTMKNLDGLYKQVYTDWIEKLIPECSIITKVVPFRESEKLGDKYHSYGWPTVKTKVIIRIKIFPV